MNRQTLNRLFIALSIVVAAWSLWIAAHDSGHLPGLDRRLTKHVLLLGWALGPPSFLWFEWLCYAGSMSDREKDEVKHTHSLARNIWLALLAILAIAFGVKLS
jgi:hypothetical protein